MAAAAAVAVVASSAITATTSQASRRPDWVGTWATALTSASSADTGGSKTGFTNQSVRMIVRTSIGGDALRVRLSNVFGTQAVAVGHVSVGRPTAAGSPDLVAGSIRDLTFNGSASTTIYKGADVLSDPLDMDVPAVSELAVTIYLSTPSGSASWHQFAGERSYVYAGDHADDPSGASPTITRSAFYFLAGIDVASRRSDDAVVVLGDSISDGAGNTFNANMRWPDQLATRIHSRPPANHDPGVLNVALSGNEVVHDGSELGVFGFGNSALARLDTDVFGQTGADTAIVELGVNDNLFSSDNAANIIGGLRQLAQQLHENGMRAIVFTVSPFQGYVGPPSWDPAKETVRLAVNDYVRSQHDYDAVVDMDKILRDPANPGVLLPAYDAGDHIHPNDAGSKAIADAIPLWLL